MPQALSRGQVNSRAFGPKNWVADLPPGEGPQDDYRPLCNELRVMLAGCMTRGMGQAWRGLAVGIAVAVPWRAL